MRPSPVTTPRFPGNRVDTICGICPKIRDAIRDIPRITSASRATVTPSAAVALAKLIAAFIPSKGALISWSTNAAKKFSNKA